MEIKDKDWNELKKLAKRWIGRRKRLGKKASDLHSVSNIHNEKMAREFFGRFNEIDRNRAELVAVINKIEKNAVAPK